MKTKLFAIVVAKIRTKENGGVCYYVKEVEDVHHWASLTALDWPQNEFLKCPSFFDGDVAWIYARRMALAAEGEGTLVTEFDLGQEGVEQQD